MLSIFCLDSNSSTMFSFNTQKADSSWKALVSSLGHTFPVSHTWIKSTHSQYLGMTAAAGGSEELFVAVLAVDRSLLLHKASVGQRWAAVGAVELLLVPRSPHGHQEWSSRGWRVGGQLVIWLLMKLHDGNDGVVREEQHDYYFYATNGNSSL